MNKKLIVLVTFIICILIIEIGYVIYKNDKDVIEEKLIDNSNNKMDSINSEKFLIENDINGTEQESNIYTNSENNNKYKEVLREVSPTGFMGSSLYKVILYTDGEIYVETFDGDGFEKQNIVSKELIAKKGKSIKKSEDDESYGMIIIKAEEIINNNIGWIEFE